MKSVLIFFVFLCTHLASAQIRKIDSLYTVLQTTKIDTVKVRTLCTIAFYETDQKKSLKLAYKALELSRKINFKSGEAFALSLVGNIYLTANNYMMAMQYFSQSMRLQERLGLKSNLASTYASLAMVHNEQGDYEEAMVYLRKSYKFSFISPYSKAIIDALFGEIFHNLKQQDSALKYFQSSYEKFNRLENKFQFNLTTNGLGDVQFAMGNHELALGFYRQALKNGLAFNDHPVLCQTYLKMAMLFDAMKQRDSTIHYAKLSLVSAKEADGFTVIIKAGKLLSNLYRDNNDAEALHYLLISQAANDSVFDREKMAKLNNMLIAENEKENEKAEQQRLAKKIREQNIEYSLIALAIIIFITLFLLLSRTIIVNEKWISFLAILALLLVFEFINLLIHPFLERITHHSPILMLLCLVALASLLIPLHHKLEHFIKHKLTEKNKAIRLAAAKKTIEQLESENN